MASDSPSRSVAVVGGGPAGLFAAERLAAAGVDVTVFEQRRSVGRTLLLAGRSGLNLTNGNTVPVFEEHLHDATGLVATAVRSFDSAALRAWADSLGAATFVGTSGRVFPEVMRATPLLRAWLARLADLDVQLAVEHSWRGWNDDGLLVFEHHGQEVTAATDAVLLALGGGSWPRVGAGGEWQTTLESADVAVEPIRAANCGLLVAWSEPLLDRFEGQPVKNVRVSFGGRTASGDLTLTRSGLEGTPVYSLASALGAHGPDGEIEIVIDLQPDRSVDELEKHLAAKRRPKDSATTWMRRAGVAPSAVAVARDATSNRLPDGAESMAQLLKAVPLQVDGLAPIERAISTAGGVRMDQLDGRFMVRARPGLFVAGEMLDWDAPTGGYLLQSCFSTGAAAAEGILAHLAK
jgi:uncharacterized flavoprotein (TIGR03862 family)